MEISRATASKPATRSDTPTTSRRRRRHTLSYCARPYNTLNFSSSHRLRTPPSISKPSLSRLPVNPFLSSPFTPFRSVFRVPTSIFNGPVTLPGNDIRPIFHGIRIPSFIFQRDPRRGLQCFPVLPGKANKRVDRAAWWNANPTCRWKFFWK